MRRITISALVVSALIAATAFAGCSTSGPLAKPGSSAPNTIKVGSANFPESEIVAEIFAQTLEAKGFQVQRQMQIGSREIFLKALDDGSIDLVPEYGGNLLRYFDKQATATSAADIAAALAKAVPDKYQALAMSKAENKDAYQVTKEFSAKHGVTSLADLAKVGKIRLGGAPELAERPYGPKGLADKYGVALDKIEFVPLSDKGGPLTVNALINGDVDVVDIFSTTPAIAINGFVTLSDPKQMIAAQNVLPLMSSRVSDPKVKAALESVTAKLTTQDLMDLNTRYRGSEKPSAAQLATDWLAKHR